MEAKTFQKRIVIRDGKLQMADGSSLRAYLREWQSKTGTRDGAFINCLPHSLMVRWAKARKDQDRKTSEYRPVKLTLSGTGEELALAS
jgi:hypothetical protein